MLFEELHDIMALDEVEALEQRFPTPDQLAASCGEEGAAAIVPGRARKPAIRR